MAINAHFSFQTTINSLELFEIR